MTDAYRFYNLSHDICYSYSYGVDNKHYCHVHTFQYYTIQQVGQLLQKNRDAAWISFGKIYVEDELCTKRCWYQKTRSIDLFARYLSTTKMSAVITLSVGKTATNTAVINFKLYTATVCCSFGNFKVNLGSFGLGSWELENRRVEALRTVPALCHLRMSHCTGGSVATLHNAHVLQCNFIHLNRRLSIEPKHPS